MPPVATSLRMNITTSHYHSMISNTNAHTHGLIEYVTFIPALSLFSPRAFSLRSDRCNMLLGQNMDIYTGTRYINKTINAVHCMGQPQRMCAVTKWNVIKMSRIGCRLSKPTAHVIRILRVLANSINKCAGFAHLVVSYQLYVQWKAHSCYSRISQYHWIDSMNMHYMMPKDIKFAVNNLNI